MYMSDEAVVLSERDLFAVSYQTCLSVYRPFGLWKIEECLHEINT